jgi:Cd(II)/Pb(II)-responsive transcriptional regulator
MKIGELAKATGIQIETIRYYEREGILPKTARSDGNYRVYSKAHVERLSFIRHCRSLDMALDEIRTLLHFKDVPSENCGDVNTLLDEHIGHVAHRIQELTTLEKQLKSLRKLCQKSQDAAHCGILNKLAEPTSKSGKISKHAGHIDGAHGRAASQRKKTPQKKSRTSSK